jgi:hypothetical protein
MDFSVYMDDVYTIREQQRILDQVQRRQQQVQRRQKQGPQENYMDNFLNDVTNSEDISYATRSYSGHRSLDDSPMSL